jgi:uncharacterized phage protein (TIGR02218 family)
MKGLSAALQAHFSGSSTTYVMCWKITPRAPGTIVGFTEHLDDVVFESVTYSARSGFSPSALRSTNDLAVDNFDVTFMLEFDGTAEAELIGGYYDYAKVEVFLLNYADLSMGKILLARGTLGEISIGRGQARTEIRGLAQELQQEVLELTSPTCRADLGDARCKVNLASFTATGTITSVSSNKIFIDSSRSEGEGHFNNGLLTWTAGDNAQLKMEVKYYSAGSKQFELHHAMPYPVQIGDTYQVYRGCDKSLSTCRNAFNNVVNFRGEPHLPGIDQVTQFGGR